MKRISVGRLLRNDRLMMLCSVLLAVFVWYFVMSGSSNISTRTITCTLNTANVSNGTLQVIEDKTITVDVVVEGVWADIIQLSSEDIRVQLNAADIQNTGNCRLNVVASRNSQKGGYDIVSTSPSTATLFCDEWIEAQEFEVSASAPLVTAEGDERDVHAVSVDESSLPGGVLLVQGPRSEVERIDRVESLVNNEASIAERHAFEGALVTMDSNGEPFDTTYCNFLRYAEDPSVNPNASLINVTALDVVVTVKERKEIPFTYEVLNVPSGVDVSSIISVTPGSVILEGEQELLNEYAEKMAQITTVDFDSLSTFEKANTIPLVLPQGLTVIGGDEYVDVAADGTVTLLITMSFDWTGYSRRIFTWDIGTNMTNTPIDFQNVPTDKTVTMLTNELRITMFGKTEALNALRKSDFSATVDMNASSLGTYTVRPQVNSGDVWVYYGSTGYTIYLSMGQTTP